MENTVCITYTMFWGFSRSHIPLEPLPLAPDLQIALPAWLSSWMAETWKVQNGALSLPRQLSHSSPPISGDDSSTLPVAQASRTLGVTLNTQMFSQIEHPDRYPILPAPSSKHIPNLTTSHCLHYCHTCPSHQHLSLDFNHTFSGWLVSLLQFICPAVYSRQN